MSRPAAIGFVTASPSHRNARMVPAPCGASVVARVATTVPAARGSRGNGRLAAFRGDPHG